VGLFLSGEAVADYEGARAAAENGRYAPFFHGLLENGVAVAPGAYEVLFPGLAHGDEELEVTAEAAYKAAARAATAR
jgi:glutamate-1-semialdehyde 2,1-aminomutase